jgi:hypothetical protein
MKIQVEISLMIVAVPMTLSAGDRVMVHRGVVIGKYVESEMTLDAPTQTGVRQTPSATEEQILVLLQRGPMDVKAISDAIGLPRGDVRMRQFVGNLVYGLLKKNQLKILNPGERYKVFALTGEPKGDLDD